MVVNLPVEGTLLPHPWRSFGSQELMECEDPCDLVPDKEHQVICNQYGFYRIVETGGLDALYPKGASSSRMLRRRRCMFASGDGGAWDASHSRASSARSTRCMRSRSHPCPRNLSWHAGSYRVRTTGHAASAHSPSRTGTRSSALSQRSLPQESSTSRTSIPRTS